MDAETERHALNPLRRRRLLISGLVIAIVVIASLVAYEKGSIRLPITSSQLRTVPPTNVPTTVIETCGNIVNLNGVSYCSLDVSDYAQIGVPGYATMNESLKFDGVLFQNVCPSIYSGCPGQQATKELILMGVVEFNLTFPDGTNETLTALLGDDIPPPVLSGHSNPTAGFEILGPFSSLKLLLLVQEQ